MSPGDLRDIAHLRTTVHRPMLLSKTIQAPHEADARAERSCIEKPWREGHDHKRDLPASLTDRAITQAIATLSDGQGNQGRSPSHLRPRNLQHFSKGAMTVMQRRFVGPEDGLIKQS